MPVFVAEVDGRPVAIFNAGAKPDAEDYTEDETFRSDLLTLEDDGRAVWDGTSKVEIREALEAEAEIWQEAWTDAVQSGDVGEDDRVCVWLVSSASAGEPSDGRANGYGVT